MKPEWAEIVEHAKNSLPIVGMMTRSTDDKSFGKLKALFERSLAGIFISAVWVVSSYNIDANERADQNRVIAKQGAMIEKSYEEIKLIMRDQSKKMDDFDAKFSEKHLLLSNRVSGLEVDVRVVQATTGIINRK